MKQSDILRLPFISYTVENDDHDETYVECTYELRYAVRPFQDMGRQHYEVEVLHISLESAVAFIGDTGVEFATADKNFEASAVYQFERWYEKEHHTEAVHAAILEHYFNEIEAAREEAAELRSERC